MMEESMTSGRAVRCWVSGTARPLSAAPSAPWGASSLRMEESMTSGRSVSCWISVTACLISAASSASGAPMFTSSSMAPPATCSLTSISTRDRSPWRSCSWKIFRPVGLIRSPMIANGWSSPIRTVLVAEDRMVCTGMFPSGACGLGVRQGAALRDQFLGPDHGRGCISRVAVRAHHVGVLLGDRGPADHDDDLIPQPGLLQRVDVRLEHRHRGGQERGEPDDVGLVLLDRLDELLRRDLHAEVDDLEAGPLEHDVDQVLADVVHVALDRAHHDR